MNTQDEESRTTEDHQDVENAQKSTNKNLEKKWTVIREEYMRTYPNITKSDVDYLTGQFEKMLGIIATRTKRSRAEVRNEIRYWNTNILRKED